MRREPALWRARQFDPDRSSHTSECVPLGTPHEYKVTRSLGVLFSVGGAGGSAFVGGSASSLNDVCRFPGDEFGHPLYERGDASLGRRVAHGATLAVVNRVEAKPSATSVSTFAHCFTSPRRGGLNFRLKRIARLPHTGHGASSLSPPGLLNDRRQAKHTNGSRYGGDCATMSPPPQNRETVYDETLAAHATRSTAPPANSILIESSSYIRTCPVEPKNSRYSR